MLNGRGVVLISTLRRDQLRPRTAFPVAPRLAREVGDLVGAVAEPREVVQEEVVQFVGADGVLCALDRAVFAGRDEFG